MISDDAKIITDIIMLTNTDDRGFLFKIISKQLSNKTNYYTAKLFTKISEEYGYDKDCDV